MTTRRHATSAFLATFLAFAPALLPAQATQTSSNATRFTPPNTLQAVRADAAPVIDGKNDDAIWATVPVQEGFRVMRPVEDGEPHQRTTFQLAYDAQNIYVFVRAYDTAPDSIIALLNRRDQIGATDYVAVILDSYHDRRTGFGFIVNPVGVKGDYSIRNDSDEDEAWDAIWDVAVARDAQGWSAEYKIPFSQLRFSPSSDMTFGVMVSRNVQRLTEQSTWPLFRMSKNGYPSQFADLVGLQGVSRPARTEVIPYVVAKNEPDPPQGGIDRQNNATVGGDLKFAVAPNITLNATANPDFGQVEADPSVLNLGAFETFFQERRPFFVEGANIFDFRINCFIVVDCQTGEGLFYSRRIGRQPQLGQYADANSPTATRILGAGKLTGRFSNGTSFGLLDAVTERVSNPADQTLEPTTNYTVGRVNRDFDRGNGSVGLMVTGVNRSLDASSDPYLHNSAYSMGFDARRKRGRFEVSGSFMGSRVEGSKEAILLTQTNRTHFFQRPDDGITLDSNATSLSGTSMELRVAKMGGNRFTFESGYGQRSSGFETNDIGFLNRADQRTWTNWAALRFNKPNRVFQRLNWNFNFWEYWTGNGLTEERSFNSNFHTQLNNRWWFHLGGTMGLGQVYCARGCTRGGPALKVEPAFSPWGGIQSDNRKKVTYGTWFNYNRADAGRSHYFSTSPWVNVKVADRFSTEFDLNYSSNRDDSQWWGNFTDGSNVTHYTFAQLRQKELGLTWRMDYTFTPTMSFQWYASPFVSKGTYSRVREVADPRASRYDDRYVAAPDTIFTAGGDTITTAAPGGFNFMAFNSNAVFRWEYRPGSTLFLVWSQGRGMFNPAEGNGNFHDNLNDLFDTRAEDRFLVKVSYWLNR